MNRESPEVTRLLAQACAGDASAAERLWPLVYDELHGLAQKCMAGERQGHTLQATALVHEAYLRLVGDREVRWQDRAHFLGVAARSMRQILVNHATKRAAVKRGGDRERIRLDEVTAAFEARSIDLLALDEALTELSAVDLQQERTVELRFFGGLTLDEIAATLGVSRSTVDRDWRMARAWLRCRIAKE